MLTASINTTTRVKPGFFAIARTAPRRSRTTFSIAGFLAVSLRDGGAKVTITQNNLLMTPTVRGGLLYRVVDATCYVMILAIAWATYSMLAELSAATQIRPVSMA